MMGTWAELSRQIQTTNMDLWWIQEDGLTNELVSRGSFMDLHLARNARDCHVDIGELLGMAKISGAWPSILTQPRELGKLRRNLQGFRNILYVPVPIFQFQWTKQIQSIPPQSEGFISKQILGVKYHGYINKSPLLLLMIISPTSVALIPLFWCSIKAATFLWSASLSGIND